MAEDTSSIPLRNILPTFCPSKISGPNQNDQQVNRRYFKRQQVSCPVLHVRAYTQQGKSQRTQCISFRTIVETGRPMSLLNCGHDGVISRSRRHAPNG